MIFLGSKETMADQTDSFTATELRTRMLALRSALAALPADDLEHCFRVGRLFQGLAEVGFMQELSDIREGMEVLLELPLGD